MDNYGNFVWSAFGFTALVMVVLWLKSLLFLRNQEKQLRKLKPDTHHDT